MDSQIEIWNHALIHIGVTTTVASASEDSKEARVLNRVWPVVRKKFLRDFNWPFATRFKTLGLIEEDPNDEWAYSYQYPSDCLKLRRILSGLRTDNQDSRVPYRVAYSDDGHQVIYTDMDEAELEYTVDHTDYGKWPIEAKVAASYLLAFYAAPAIAAKEEKLGKRAYELYLIELSNSRANSVHEENLDPEPDSSFVRARE